MNLISLAYKSFRNRKFTVVLTVASIAVSIVLLLGVSRLNSSVESGFTNSISSTDLIVGARTGEEQLVLATVFNLGKLNNQVNWKTYKELANDKRIKWTFPISIGDSHKGFNVIGTTPSFFKRYQYGEKRSIHFAHGKVFEQLFDVVLGAKVAKKNNYKLGDQLHLQHGSDAIQAHNHDEHAFKVSGVLKETGTPIDNNLYIQLRAFEGIHLNYVDGLPDDELSFSKEEIQELELQPQYISAFFLGLNQRTDLLSLQREINTYSSQALTAASPSFTLISLWSIMQKVETVLNVISVFVVMSGLTAMLIALLTGIKERRREMAILRSLGAASKHIYVLIIGESLIITATGVSFGVLILTLLSVFFNPLLNESYGISINSNIFQFSELLTLTLVSVIGIFIGFIPAYLIHRTSLKDGMTIKI